MIVKWRRLSLWHAFIFFEDHETMGSVCHAFVKPTNLVDNPGTQGTDLICASCKMGVLGTRKRYKLIRNEDHTDDGS